MGRVTHPLPNHKYIDRQTDREIKADAAPDFWVHLLPCQSFQLYAFRVLSHLRKLSKDFP